MKRILTTLLAKLALHAAAAIGTTQLVVDPLAVGRIRCGALLFSKLDRSRLERARPLSDDATQLLRLTAQLVLGDLLQASVMFVDLVNDRLNLAPLALVSRSEDGVDQSLEHSVLYRYSCFDSMNLATDSGTKPRIDFPVRTRSRTSVDDTSTSRVTSVRAPRGTGA